MHIETWPVGRLVPYANNPRDNDGAVDAVVASLTAFGWRQPIVIDRDGVIVVGHTRYKAALKMGLAEVPVHVAADLTEAQARAYRVADNQTAQVAGWDADLLPIELAGIAGAGIDLGLLGFTAAELARWTGDGGAAGLTDPDAAPPVPAEPVTRPGDLWLLGDHRMLCGDSTRAADVERLLAGAEPFLMVTDPPYGVEYDPAWRHASGLNYSSRTGKVANDDRADWTEAYKLFPGRVAYVWHAGRFAGTVAANLEAAGFGVRAQIIWRKSRFAIGRGAYHWQHEPCWYAVREGGGGAKWCGDRTQSTVWDVPPGGQDLETAHGTQKPVECMARPVRNHGGADDAVYDPFCGSGTTVIACERLGRRCLALELDPGYCDEIVRRWEAFTGRQAERRTAGGAGAAAADDEQAPASAAGAAGKAGAA